MKYMVMMFGSAAAMSEERSPEWITEMMGFMQGLGQELTDSGELVFAEGLQDGSAAKIVRLTDGVPVTTDGPYAEAKEHMGGYLIVDCESLDRATEIALRWPNSRFAAMEVRPIMDVSGTEM